MADGRRMKKLSKGLGDTQMAHNRRVSAFERSDFAEWSDSKKLDPVERLAARWLTDADALRRNDQPEMAKVLERHAKELKQAMSGRK